MVTGDFESEIRQVCQNITALLKEAGCGWEHLVKVGIFTTDLSKFDLINAVYSEFVEAPYPARAAVEVAGLPKGHELKWRQLHMLNEDVYDSIDRLVSKVGKKDNQKVLKEILSTVCRLSDMDINSGDWKLLSRSIKEFRKSFQAFTPYRNKRKVAIFGSARTPEKDPLFKMAEEFSRDITRNDFMVITGAGGGIMEAGNKGGGDESFGVNIKLPFEQSANDYIRKSKKLVSYNYFFIRKLMFIKESDATVLFPGGFGTLDEAYEGLTLIQTGKSLPRPILLMQNPGDDYWQTWVSFFSEIMLRDKYISPDDMDLFSICESNEEAINIITSFL